MQPNVFILNLIIMWLFRLRNHCIELFWSGCACVYVLSIDLMMRAFSNATGCCAEQRKLVICVSSNRRFAPFQKRVRLGFVSIVSNILVLFFFRSFYMLICLCHIQCETILHTGISFRLKMPCISEY